MKILLIHTRKIGKIALPLFSVIVNSIPGMVDGDTLYWGGLILELYRTEVPLRFVTYLSKVKKLNKKKVFWPSDRFIVGQSILGHALYRGPNFFSSQYKFHGYQKTQNFM
jgi:hypothetical protein